MNQPFNRCLDEYAYGVIAQFIDQVDSATQNKLIAFYSCLHDELNPEPERPKQPLPPRNERQKFIQRLLSDYQAKIEMTAGYIASMDKLIDKVSRSSLSEHNLRLIHHYQSVRAGFVISLAKTRTLQQKKLDRLESQLA